MFENNFEKYDSTSRDFAAHIDQAKSLMEAAITKSEHISLERCVESDYKDGWVFIVTIDGMKANIWLVEDGHIWVAFEKEENITTFHQSDADKEIQAWFAAADWGLYFVHADGELI